MANEYVSMLERAHDALTLACMYIASMGDGCPLIMLANPRCKECRRSFDDIAVCWRVYFMAKAKVVRDE